MKLLIRGTEALFSLSGKDSGIRESEEKEKMDNLNLELSEYFPENS